MKLELYNERITYLRKTTEYDFTLTNNKGEDMEIIYQTSVFDSEDGGYDSDQQILDEKGEELSSKALETFLGDDYDEDLISHLEEAIGNKINNEEDVELVFIGESK